MVVRRAAMGRRESRRGPSSRDLARGGSPADEPEKTLPGSDISEAEQKAALREEQRRRAEQRARRNG
jgi:hypothetical protein